MRRVLVLADDLTGALEAGVLLDGAAVALHAAPDAGAVVVDTESRHLTPQEARRRVAEWIEQIPSELIYKKTDSTLRGNIGAELAALPPGRIHYAPAYPRLGRTVRGGRLYVDGVPVEETAFARDPLDPVRCGAVLEVLQRQHAPIGRVVIHEGASDEDLDAAAAAVLAEPVPRLAAGPAGLLACLAMRLGLARRPLPLPPIPGCLVINGSAHPASLLQIETARSAGVLTGGWREARAGDSALQDAPAIVVFGGDTARAILQRFGSPPLHPVAELLPGVVASRFAAGGRTRWLVTKAGGFGPPDLLIRLSQLLRPHNGRA